MKSTLTYLVSDLVICVESRKYHNRVYVVPMDTDQAAFGCPKGKPSATSASRLPHCATPTMSC